MKNYFFILGHPFPKKEVYRFTASILILATGLVGCYYLILLKKHTPAHINLIQSEPSKSGIQTTYSLDSADSSETKEVITKTSPLPEVSTKNLNNILEAHLEATGMGEVKSFTMEGIPWKDKSLERRFSIKSLRPNLYKLKVSYLGNSHSIEFGYNGKDNWVEHSWGKAKYSNEETDKYIVLMLASPAHLAWSYRSEKAETIGIDSVLEIMPMKERKGQMCHVVRSKGLLPFYMDHFINAEHFHEIYRLAVFKKPDGNPLLLEVEFDPSCFSKDTDLPLRQNVYMDGKLIDEITYKSVSINRFMPSILFAPLSGE
jgi:hypothetical protein